MAILKFKDLRHLPGEEGNAFIGHFREFLAGSTDMYSRLQNSFGDIFAVKIWVNSSVALVNPKHNKLILVDNAAITENKEAWETSLSELFPNGLMLMDGDEHKYHRGIMLDAFKKPAMKGYLTIMPGIIEEAINSLPSNGKQEMFPFFKLLTLQLASKVFFGLENTKDLSDINIAVSNIVNAASAIPIKIPGTTFYKGIKGRKFLVKLFLTLIKERKANPGNDLFSRLCLAKDENGKQFSDTEIVDHLIFILMASHDTTAITLTFVSYYLAKHPEWQKSIRDELLELNNTITEPTDLRQFEKLNLVIKEVLRLRPPLTQVVRKLTKELEVDGITIPKDAVVSIIMQKTQRDERVWTNPSAFDPMRFDKSRAEDKKCPFAYSPFGAGQHHCIGYAFADMQIKLVISALLKKFDLSVTADYVPNIQEVPLQQPKDGMPIILNKI
jgi:cytochrome P450